MMHKYLDIFDYFFLTFIYFIFLLHYYKLSICGQFLGKREIPLSQTIYILLRGTYFRIKISIINTNKDLCLDIFITNHKLV